MHTTFSNRITATENGTACLWPEDDRPAASGQEPSELHLAVGRGDPEAVRQAIEAGLDVNAPAWFGLTPLHLCMRRYALRKRSYVSTENDEAVLNLLLAGGANVRARDFRGEMPAAWAEGFMPAVLRAAMLACAESGAWPEDDRPTLEWGETRAEDYKAKIRPYRRGPKWLQEQRRAQCARNA